MANGGSNASLKTVSSSAQAQGPLVHTLGAPFNVAWLWLRLSRCDDALISRWLSMLGVMLTPLAVLAGTLGVWRLAADPGWTSHFFIASGLLSHGQVWFTVAMAVRASSLGLNKWLDKTVTDASMNAPILVDQQTGEIQVKAERRQLVWHILFSFGMIAGVVAAATGIADWMRAIR